MAGYPCRRASFTWAVSFILLLGLTAPAWCADAGAVDTNFPCYQCHSKKEITPWIASTCMSAF